MYDTRHVDDTFCISLEDFIVRIRYPLLNDLRESHNEELIGEYGIPAQRYRPIIATFLERSLNYNRWKNGGGSGQKIPYESIMITEVHFRVIPREKSREIRLRKGGNIRGECEGIHWTIYRRKLTI